MPHHCDEKPEPGSGFSIKKINARVIRFFDMLFMLYKNDFSSSKRIFP
jgi:hypothetical protein